MSVILQGAWASELEEAGSSQLHWQLHQTEAQEVHMLLKLFVNKAKAVWRHVLTTFIHTLQ